MSCVPALLHSYYLSSACCRAAGMGILMASSASMINVVFLIILLQSMEAPPSQAASEERIRTYIVHASLEQRPLAFSTSSQWYASAMASVTGLPLHQSLSRHGPIYTYHTVFQGFSAKLTPSQVSSLLRLPGFLLAIPDKSLNLHTTRTPEFLHLTPSEGLWPESSYGHDVIVGVIDTGIWPERPSFNDVGFDAVPSRWKGACEEAAAFNSSLCNKKLIGARAFYKGYEAVAGPIDESREYKSPRDSKGHGSHTASTAAGSFVANVSLFGYAPGDARGMAPHACLAVYKVCWEAGCYSSDILAGFDSAVADGVDIISVSLGGRVVPFYGDSIALGSYGAMEKGVLVSCSAGNSGPTVGTVANVAPWILTVGASTVDRNFPATVALGNGSLYEGVSLYDGMSKWDEGQQLPLVYAGDVGLNGNPYAYLCITGSLDPERVQGKLVLCDRGANGRVAKGQVVYAAGGLGMILANTADSGSELLADCHLLPTSTVSYQDGIAIKEYIASVGSNATATIYFNGTKLDVMPAPVMASFSSRGPNPLPAELLKPDVTAPGLNILAAYTGATGPAGLDDDDRRVEFTIMSGTSMSCPHVSGLAALLKAAHPTWSPAAIKSALMTSSSFVDNTGNPLGDASDGELANPFAYGAGHVDPQAALDPGLVYNLTTQDYVNFLCSLGYTGAYLNIFTNGNYNCTDASFRPGDLNYPSFAIVFEKGDNESISFMRTVTNVGDMNATYTVHVVPPQGVSIVVDPEELEFHAARSVLNYTVTFHPISADSSISPLLTTASPMASAQEHYFGSMTWVDGAHAVYSPIAVTFQGQKLQTI